MDNVIAFAPRAPQPPILPSLAGIAECAVLALVIGD